MLLTSCGSGPPITCGQKYAELAQRRGVKRARLHTLGAELAQPGAQLAGRPRGEGDGEHLAGRELTGHHLIGDPAGDRAGLAGAGAGQHADRPDRSEDHPPLLRIEPFQDETGLIAARILGKCAHVSRR